MNRNEPFAFARDFATRWDLIAAVVVIGLIVFLGEASRGLFEPLARLDATPLSLDPANLPFYAARTALRMLAALALSLLFTLTYATWAAKNERAGKLLVPILDILQSVPILGFISVTVVFFMSLAPGRVLGAEFAAIFAIFTSQAWNMAFSFYQSLRTVPAELGEAADSFLLTPWMRFWQLEVPFGLPALVWNMMMSMSGGWFFVVASESISVGHTTVTLPGVGSYIALAIEQRNLHAIGWAIFTMLIVILLYDQLLFRPLISWVDRFRVEQDPGGLEAPSWALTMMRRSKLIAALSQAFYATVRWTSWALPRPRAATTHPTAAARRANPLWLLLLAAVVGLALWHIARTLIASTTSAELLEVLGLACLTLLRVAVLIALASLLWVPVGIWVGLRPRAAQVVQPIAQFLAAFPANLLFPLAVLAIVEWKLDPDIWLSPLMILGTQWYILFNVIAGASQMPSELRYAAQNFRVGGWLWWRKVALPAVLPFYVTGAITASGGSWNAAIVAEIATWGKTTVIAHGLGAYIAQATTAGDYHRIILGIATMCVFVVAINRLFWRPLYYYAERKFRLT
ncbi:MAG TPA: ABC transporter permease subunit [Steroidobacteraceae bacterium]|nr:ABC transporter permease subunit [Steroidobacteraceae bacterium]